MNNTQTVTIDNREGGAKGGGEKKKSRGSRGGAPSGALLGLAAVAGAASLVHSCYKTNPEYIGSLLDPSNLANIDPYDVF